MSTSHHRPSWLANRWLAALSRSGSIICTNQLVVTTVLGQPAYRRYAHQPSRTPYLKGRRSDNDQRSRPVTDYDRWRGVFLLKQIPFSVMTNLFQRFPSTHRTKADRELTEFMRHFYILCMPSGPSGNIRMPNVAAYVALRDQYFGGDKEWQTRDIYWLADCFSKAKITHVLGSMLFRCQSLSGDLDATTIILAEQLRHATRTHRGMIQLDHQQRGLLRKGISSRPSKQTWRAAVLEGKIMEAYGHHKDALHLYKQALKGAADSVNGSSTLDTIHKLEDLTPRVMQDDRWKLDVLTELERPWRNAVQIYKHMKARLGDDLEAHNALSAEARDVVLAGCRGDDAECYYDAAQWAERDYPFEQMSVEEKDGLVRVARQASDIRGTSARWLAYMSKAAASGVPQACHDLGRYYRLQEWPYLDEEPPDTIKPTPFDRYPAKKRSSLLRRLYEAFGLPSTRARDEELRDEHDDIFLSAAVPATPELRMQVAIDWLKAAVQLNYAPALRDLIEIYTHRTISTNIGIPPGAYQLSSSRYGYRSREDYWLKLELNEGDIDRRWPKEQVVSIPNPFYNENEAEQNLVLLFHALEARNVFSNGANEQEEPRSAIYPLKFLERWTMQSETFKDWAEDVARCQELHTFARKVCDDNKWSIHDEDGGLVYRYRSTYVSR